MMVIYFKLRLNKIILLGLYLLLVTMLTHSARAEQSSPVDIHIALVSPASICQGEPIILQYKISNTSDQRLVIHTGSDNSDWYSLALSDATGRDMPAVPDRPIALSGFRPEASKSIPNHKATEGYIIPNQRFKSLSPGRYTLTAHVHLPFVVTDTNTEGNLDAPITALGTVCSEDITIPITITPLAPRRLRATAEALRKVIMQEKDAAQRDAEAKALFSMPEAQAVPSWQALIAERTDPTETYRALTIQEMSRLRSAAAADILANIIWDQAPTKGTVTTDARIELGRMYSAADAALKQHIQDLYKDHGEDLPKYSIMGNG